jgi:hypothetical protein
VVFGPQGCGKARNAKRLARAFGLSKIVDDFDGSERVPATDTLVLSNLPDSHFREMRRAYPFADAMRSVARFEKSGEVQR